MDDLRSVQPTDRMVAHGDPHATRPDGSWMPPMPPVMGDWVLVIERA
ncbi:MAG: hypothetical protein QM328_12260 [Acidobacteriota bacterium]|nr:hypothetical protein [Acidobacteriota bacterium]